MVASLGPALARRLGRAADGPGPFCLSWPGGHLGTVHRIVAVNKMDTAKYSEERFLEIKKEVSSYIKKVGRRGAIFGLE